nr:hypothetical protein CFP56_67250 [Quercus suber]
MLFEILITFSYSLLSVLQEFLLAARSFRERQSMVSVLRVIIFMLPMILWSSQEYLCMPCMDKVNKEN